MQIEAGKYYRDRVGRVHGPMYVGTGLKPWAAGDGPSNTWTMEGLYYRKQHPMRPTECARDLIMEVPAPSERPAVSYAPDVSPAKALTDERKDTHGNWLEQGEFAQEVKELLRTRIGWDILAPHQREAVDMIAMKLSRILCGDPTHADHWDDIAGYAYLGKGGHGK